MGTDRGISPQGRDTDGMAVLRPVLQGVKEMSLN